MAAENYDPNQDLNPKLALWLTVILVIAGFATVTAIVVGSEMKNAPAPQVEAAK